MDKIICDNYVAILKNELIASFGCTEPIVIAYASAKAREVLGEDVVKLELLCSGNVIKNVKSVIVPNSDGERGIPIAAALGALGGDASQQLEVLSAITPEKILQAKAFVAAGKCTYDLIPGVPNLYVAVTATGEHHTAKVVLEKEHTQITEIRRDGEFFLDASVQEHVAEGNKDLLNVRDILTFAQETPLTDVEPLLRRQTEMNAAISQEGLTHAYGAQVGRTLLETYDPQDVKTRARARAAAGSDARMSGCELPVVINSGSGNQGITASVPVIVYARELGVSDETLLRALTLSNLTTIHEKTPIGRLSAYCGAISAGAGAGAGIAYLCGGDYDAVIHTVVNALAVVSGVICDGAKASCAAKIATAVEAGLLGYNMYIRGNQFRAGDGIVAKGVENSLKNVGRLGKQGMKETNNEIIAIMVGC